MNTALEEINELLQKGRDLVVATIIDHRGSTPRTSGSKMIVLADGSIYGTIGGGAVEGNVIKLATQLFSTQGALIAHYDLSDSDHAGGMDLICGGRIQILLEHVPVSDTNRELYRSAVEMIRNGHSFLWKARITAHDRRWRVERKIETEAKLKPSGRAASSVQESADVVNLVEPFSPADPVFIIGGGHVSKALALLAQQVGFRTLVFDDREAFANEQRFPGADEIHVCPGYENLFESFMINRSSSIVIVTRGHHFDQQVLAQALRTKAGYIGMIGSRRKRETIFRKLVEKGFSASALEQIHCPIGISIDAETPAEIGVSVVAELIQQRAQRRQHG
jgi:xanthine dehydrogenase accessory factor